MPGEEALKQGQRTQDPGGQGNTWAWGPGLRLQPLPMSCRGTGAVPQFGIHMFSFQMAWVLMGRNHCPRRSPSPWPVPPTLPPTAEPLGRAVLLFVPVTDRGNCEEVGLDQAWPPVTPHRGQRGRRVSPASRNTRPRAALKGAAGGVDPNSLQEARPAVGAPSSSRSGRGLRKRLTAEMRVKPSCLHLM